MPPSGIFNFFLDTDAKQYSQELRLRSDTESFKWVTGVYYLGLELEDQNRAITDPWAPPPPGAEPVCSTLYLEPGFLFRFRGGGVRPRRT